MEPFPMKIFSRSIMEITNLFKTEPMAHMRCQKYRYSQTKKKTCRLNWGLSLVLCLFFSCSINDCLPKKYSERDVLFYVKFLGENIDEVFAKYRKNATLDAMVGDAGVEWKILRFHHSSDVTIAMETSWKDHIHISRISIFTPDIKIDDIFVGQTIENVRTKIKEQHLGGYDGELILGLKKFDNVFLEMDMTEIDKNESVWYGDYLLETLPANLKIKSIIITTPSLDNMETSN